MSILVIHPLYTIGSQFQSELDVCLLNQNNILNNYADQTDLYMNTAKLFEYYLSERCIYPIQRIFEDALTYSMLKKNFVHAFFKILTAYNIQAIHIHNHHFFDLLYIILTELKMIDRLKKYNSIIKLYVNKFVWHLHFHEQHITLTDNDKYPIDIIYNNMTDIIYNAVNIDYSNFNTQENRQITIHCEIMPYLNSIREQWEQTITNLIDTLYNSVDPDQQTIYLNITLNVNVNLSTTQIPNLLYISKKITPYMPIEKIFLANYDINFNYIDVLLSVLRIRLKMKNPNIDYDYDYLINYFLV